MRHPHLLEQLHILANLVVVFGLGTAELKVDDMRLAPVSHHTVGTTLEDGSVGIQTENGALVEQRPIIREPITYTSVFKSFVQHFGKLVARHFIVVKHALLLQLQQGSVDVGGGADGAENLVQHTTHLDIAELLRAVVIALDEVATAVALAELRLDVEGFQMNVLRRGGLQENVGGGLCGGSCWGVSRGTADSGNANRSGGAIGKHHFCPFVSIARERAARQLFDQYGQYTLDKC